MSNRAGQELTLPRLRMLCAVLVSGEVLFAAVVAFLMYGGSDLFEGSDASYLGVFAAAFAVVIVPVAFFLRGKQFAKAGGLEGGARTQAYGVAVLMFFAFLEGAAFMNIVAWMVMVQSVPPVAVLVVLVAIQLASFPSRAQLDDLRG